jgi:choline dehydrogenase-like flavoprotein
VIEADVCIIGSGAAGATLAYHLAKAGREVLVVERGRYVEPRAFSEDEVEMIGKLYADGVFQQTQDFRFTVLQGSCVGGSTVVNNAVCFEPPDHVLARWNDPAIHAAGLDLARLRASVADIVAFLPITTQDRAPLNPSAPKYIEGARALGLRPPELEVDVVRANIKDCFGCGYCNIGCAFGKKLSMLDTTLPWAQRDFPGRVRILAECEVGRLRALSGHGQRVIDARAAFPDGRRITIRAQTFVLSAGAIASSYLLLRSGVGRDLPVGQHLCFNMGAPLTAEFADVMNAYDGLQISHFGRPRPERGFVYETWWNPPVAQAVNMPGWFEDHFENMRRYNRLMAVGVLVGTAGNAQVKEALTGGPDIVYTPEAADLRKLGGALKELGQILFAGGAQRVMANTWGYDVFKSPQELDRLERIALDPSYIALGTGHPQGGNALSTDPRRGVVGPDFRVHGFKNLYVCDASVFPSSLTVNPQLTIMSLAHYASPLIR